MSTAELSRKEFDLLVALEESRHKTLSQRRLSEISGVSLATVNKLLSDLASRQLLSKEGITQVGIDALDGYKVNRVIFFAAGFGSRLVPITLNTPKPLVRVNGVRMIDTLLDAVTAMGISDITIVRGYLSEQFDQLKYKYPTIKFIENPAYNESNNISSAMCARYSFGGAYIMEADLVLSNPKILKKYHYTSNYLGVPTKVTNDWCFETKGGIIKKLKVGGTDCHHMFGISYWNNEDGAKLSEHIKKVYDMPGGHERYWDQVALEYFASEYKVAVSECSFDDIVEIDSYRDLKTIDPTYGEV